MPFLPRLEDEDEIMDLFQYFHYLKYEREVYGKA